MTRRPGHLSPCLGELCPTCHGETNRWSDLTTASNVLERLVHKTRDQKQAKALWEAKKLVDEVINESHGEFEEWLALNPPIDHEAELMTIGERMAT